MKRKQYRHKEVVSYDVESHHTSYIMHNKILYYTAQNITSCNIAKKIVTGFEQRTMRQGSVESRTFNLWVDMTKTNFFSTCKIDVKGLQIKILQLFEIDGKRVNQFLLKLEVTSWTNYFKAT